eukprot:5274086-Pyramimonas_sp.AAC.1
MPQHNWDSPDDHENVRMTVKESSEGTDTTKGAQAQGVPRTSKQAHTASRIPLTRLKNYPATYPTHAHQMARGLCQH